MATMAHPSAGGFSSQAAVVLGTSIAAFLSGFALGIYSIRGYLLVSPSLEAQRRAQVTDPVESEASDIEVDDDMARQQLSHAPNWANRRDADRRDGLVAEGTRTPTGTATPDRLRVPDREQGGSRLSRESSASELRQRQPSPSSPATLAQMNEECKLVLVVRTDLGMTKGGFWPRHIPSGYR